MILLPAVPLTKRYLVIPFMVWVPSLKIIKHCNVKICWTHFKQMYQPSNCTIMVAGKVDEQTLKLLTRSFGDEWTNSAVKADTSQPGLNPSGEHFYFVEKPEALQSAIRMGLPSITRTHPDFPALQVVNTVLGGYFGSRLMANIREDKGYTYGIGSGISSLNTRWPLFIATEVGADVCQVGG